VTGIRVESGASWCHTLLMSNVLERFRAWLRKRETAPIEPSTAEANRQDAMSAASTGKSTGAGHGNIPPGYLPTGVDEGRPRH
jgi:hypothetical protein